MEPFSQPYFCSTTAMALFNWRLSPSLNDFPVLSIGDLNNDGRGGLVSGASQFALSNGNGTFTVLPGVAGNLYATADFKGDGKLDAPAAQVRRPRPRCGKNTIYSMNIMEGPAQPSQCVCTAGQKLNSNDTATSDWRFVANSGICQRSYCTLPEKRKPGPVKISAFTATSF